MDSISVLKAQRLAQQRGLSPKDFVGYDPTMPNRWNNQALADALNMDIMSTGSRNQRVLASPTASQPAPTSEDVLARYGSLGATDFDMLNNPTSYLTDKGKAAYQINQPLRAAELQAMSAGMNLSPEQINEAYGSGYTGAVRNYNDYLRWKEKDENRGGFLGFMDKATPAITKAAFAYFGGNALGNALNLGNTAALAPGAVPTASAPVMIPGTEIPLSTAANVGRTAYAASRSDNPEQILANAAFPSNFMNRSLPDDFRNLSVFQDLSKRYGLSLGQPEFNYNVKTPDIVPQNFDKGGQYSATDVRPTPEQRPTIGALARMLQKADEFVRKPFGYDNPPVQIASDLLRVPELYRTMENYAYGSPLASGTSSVSRYLPRLSEDTKGAIEGAINLAPMVGPAMRATKATARAAAPYAAQQAVNLVEKYGVAPTMNVIKPKGGNWLTGDIEYALSPLRSKVVGEEPVERLKKLEDYFADQRAKGVALDYSVLDRERARMVPDIAINRWIDTKLNKYIRNEMATPEDPVRALAEQGVSHLPIDLVGNVDVLPMGTLAQKRMKGGFPAEGMGQSPAARTWEYSADSSIKPRTAGNAAEYEFNVEEMPWLKKLDPETPVYGIPSASSHDLGFGHLIDELKAAMSPTSELPQHLRLDPKDIDKVTMPQAVERVAKINAWRAEQAAQAEKAGMMENLQATPRLADESLQLSFVEKPGGAWVDIPETINEKGMRLCTSIGKAGGWCTKNEGLATTYGSGENRLTALVDAEGRPHAQAKITTDADHLAAFEAATETLTPQQVARWEDDMTRIMDRPPELEEGLDWMEHNAPEAYAAYKQILTDQGKNSLPDITELKPPGNSFNSERAQEYAKRDPQYKQKVTQSVLNFLNSGEWGRVADLHHYDIVDTQRDPVMLLSYLRHIVGKDADKAKDLFNAAIDANPNVPRFMTPRQLRDFIGSIEPLEGYAEGGKKKPSPFDELEPTFGQRMGATAADKLTEAGLWLYDKLAERDKLSSAHKIYLDTFVHDNRAPITAKDFNPQDLVELQNLIRQKEKLTGGKGAGYIEYEDYKTLPSGDQRRGHTFSSVSGVMPPRPALANSLGQFNYQREPKTGQYRIIDEYDFNPQKITHMGEKVDVPPEFYGDYIPSDFSLWKLARLYGGRKMPPGKGRKVELSVPGKAEGGLMKYDPDEVVQLAASVVPGYAAGGLVNYDPAEIDTMVSRIREELHG